MSSDMTSLLLVGGLVVGGIYLYNSGMLDSILGGFGGPQGPIFDQYEKEAEEGDGDEDEDEDKDEKKGKTGGKGGRGGKGGKSGRSGRKRNRDKRREDVYPPQGPMGYPTPQYIPPAGPPGLTSSMIPVQTPQYPPYTSQTVGTYSPYSPYNQFNAYQEYRTPPRGVASTMPDDNIGFTDIDTGKGYGCFQCQNFCRASPNSYQCASCRMPCKRISHQFIPPSKGWTIGPVGQIPYGSGGGGSYSPYGSYLGMMMDNLLGRGATFAEMDDYSQKRRFDCHNKLKRRAKGKDNSFVSQQDYYYDRNDIQLANV